jgi:hypothetical protein
MESPRPAPNAEQLSRPGVLSRLVGLFALWQLAFVPLANLMEFVPLRPGPGDENRTAAADIHPKPPFDKEDS